MELFFVGLDLALVAAAALLLLAVIVRRGRGVSHPSASEELGVWLAALTLRTACASAVAGDGPPVRKQLRRVRDL